MTGLMLFQSFDNVSYLYLLSICITTSYGFIYAMFFAVDDCKKRWRNIKDTYARNKNRRTGSAAPPASKNGRTWALEDQSGDEHRM